MFITTLVRITMKSRETYNNDFVLAVSQDRGR